MEVFDIVENMPAPAGGMEGWSQYLANSLEYPSKAKAKGITGTVYLTFIVDTEGSIHDVQVFRGIGSGLDEEAIKAIKNAPKWEPGTQGDKRVNVKMRVPIRFSLNKATGDSDNIPMGNVIGEETDQRKGELKVDASYGNGVWSGVVRDPDGNVLPGVTIVKAETSTGTVSDINGRFSIKTSQSGDLYASFAGYKSVRLKEK